LNQSELKRVAYLGILLFGLVSLSGDLIYEGARSILPNYLYALGASASIVGFASGLGEFFGYALRLVSGYLADTTRAYWFFTLAGYLLLISVPLQAFAGLWQVAIILLLVERIAKAMRSPSRDVLLSHISGSVGAGKAFGLHELMDQIGAIGGPFIVAATLYMTGNSYFYSFLALFGPYILLALSVLYAYYRLKPYTETIVKIKGSTYSSQLSFLTSKFAFYTIAVALNTAGLIHVSLILYRASSLTIVWILPVLYLAAQATDAVAAPTAGYLYDKYGRKILLIAFLLSTVPSILTFTGGFESIVTAILIFGIVYGMQESIYRAAVSDIAPKEARGLAYGLFYTAYGVGFLVSGSIFGQLLDLHFTYLAIVYSVCLQIVASILLKKSIS